jgi:hypothetical protein
MRVCVCNVTHTHTHKHTHTHTHTHGIVTVFLQAKIWHELLPDRHIRSRALFLLSRSPLSALSRFPFLSLPLSSLSRSLSLTLSLTNSLSLSLSLSPPPARLTIKLDRLIVLSKSSLLGWFLHVSLIVIIKGRSPMEVSLILIIKPFSHVNVFT